MDAIRLRQIDEALSYDRNINAMVFDIEKKRVARYPDEPMDSQIDADIKTTTKDNVNALRVILDNKYANLSTMLSPGMNLQSAEFANSSKKKKVVASGDNCTGLQYYCNSIGVKQEPDVHTEDPKHATRAT